MAERIVLSAVDKLGRLVAQEAVLLYGVGDQLDRIKSELSMMRSFLRDAVSKSRWKQDERARRWVEDIRDAAYEAEDIVDLYLYDMSRDDFNGVLQRVLFIPRHQLGTRIQSLRSKIEDISKRKETYDIKAIDEIEQEQTRHQRPVLPHVADDEIVGLGIEKDEITQQLLDGHHYQELSVVSIVGQGGLGKTTLAQLIFKSYAIQSHFDCLAWITVSQDYKSIDIILKEIIRKISRSESHNLDKKTTDQLIEELHQLLMTKKYLIALDDVWTPNLWREVKSVLPDEEKGSRVLMTTRSHDVAREACTRFEPYELRFLNNEESTDLFLKKAFPSPSCPEELSGLVPCFVEKCAGLPLALVVLGGLLRTKAKTHRTWSNILKIMDWQLDGRSCMEVLSWSYEDLPYYLKPCFLYFAVFPEDRVINVSTLLKLWIAEGFLSGQESDLLEDIAENWLEELIQRSLVQVIERKYNGSVKTCRVHDLLHELATKEAQREKFVTVYKNEDQEQTHGVIERRLALHGNIPHGFESFALPKLRSIIAFNIKQPISCEGRFILLKVLSLDVEIHETLPDGFKRLIHLRYLRFKYLLNELPHWIGELKNLETFVIEDDCKVYLASSSCTIKTLGHLPSSLWTIKTLRHLHFPFIYLSEVSCMNLKNLQTLKGVILGTSIQMMVLSNLTNLRRLRLTVSDDVDGDHLVDLLKKLQHLISFSIRASTFKMAENWTMVHPSLENIQLEGRWIPSIASPCQETFQLVEHLTKLTLIHTRFKEDPMPWLEKLPNLKFLRLSFGSYEGAEMVCSGFPELRRLHLSFLPGLRRWIVKEGSMPKLCYLMINSCEMLEMLPELQHVSSLRELELLAMPKEFLDGIKEEGGHDWHKVRSIPSITISERMWYAK